MKALDACAGLLAPHPPHGPLPLGFIRVASNTHLRIKNNKNRKITIPKRNDVDLE
jgi:hypothetical protein